METRAYLKGTRLSPQKAGLIADQIRGKSVDEAMDFLVFKDRVTCESTNLKTYSQEGGGPRPHQILKF